MPHTSYTTLTKLALHCCHKLSGKTGAMCVAPDSHRNLRSEANLDPDISVESGVHIGQYWTKNLA